MITKEIKSAKLELTSATIRDFTGGWNDLDDDLNLSSRYSKRQFNVSTAADGSVSVRYGTRMFADLQLFFSTPGAQIVNITYFSNAVIVVASNGDVLRVYGDGTIARIWDASIAAALPGSPSGWSATDFASFAQFNDELIICNGVDKPLIVAADLTVDYLQDLGTNTNINTPIARYVVACDRYVVMAGDPVNPYRIHISARDASGTWYGDPDPNDATFIDVGSLLNGASFIRGIASFRGKLIVGFAEGTVVAQLGNYDTDDNHDPQFEEPVEHYGSVSHRSMISYGDDMLMMDLVGVPSLRRTVFTGTLRPERISDLIGPAIASHIRTLDFAALEDHSFAVYNQKEGQFLFFLPDKSDYVAVTETKAYVFTYIPTLKVSRWARFDGWNFSCACRTIQGEIIFGDKSGKLWLYGSRDIPIYADYLNDSSINSGNGVPITFGWELPWTDFSRRTETKTTRYISFDTRGTANFTVSMFVDRLMKDENNADRAQLVMEMVGGDTPAFGGGDQPYGSGRNTTYEKLYSWPAKFKQMKLRIEGQVTDPLSFISISLLYLKGKYFR